MKKVVIGFSIVFVLVLISIFIYNLVKADNEVKILEDVISYQYELEEYFDAYGYTIDNPNVVIDPYDNSPLTALVMFVTEDEVKIKVTVKGKNNSSDISYETESTKIHYIPVYGLYAGGSNEVILNYGNINKVLYLETEEIGIDTLDNYNAFVREDGYCYYVDGNGDVRWYLEGYTGNLDRISNGNFILATSRKNSNQFYTGMVEIDMLGKIYYEYNVEYGYSGSYILIDNNIWALGDNYLYTVSRQSGEVIFKYKLDEYYNYIDYKDGNIILGNEEESVIFNRDSLELEESSYMVSINNKYDIDFISNSVYKKGQGIRFGNKSKTSTVNKSMMLINYDYMDKDKLDIYKEFDRLVVNVKDKDYRQIYVILDSIWDRKVYKMDKNDNYFYKYINDEGIKGKYSIYLKMDSSLYKTNYYVNFK